MKAKPLRILNGVEIECDPIDAEFVLIRIPCRFSHRKLPVMLNGQRSGTNCWTWNGDTEKPTFRPSVLTKIELVDGVFVCHSWVTDGVVQFLDDCTHINRSQSIKLLDIDTPISEEFE
jgi:Family of unknown function (DUF6527)